MTAKWCVGGWCVPQCVTNPWLKRRPFLGRGGGNWNKEAKYKKRGSRWMWSARLLALMMDGFFVCVCVKGVCRRCLPFLPWKFLFSVSNYRGL